MNHEWNLQYTKFQRAIKHKKTFSQGINDLLVLRKMLINHLLVWKNELDNIDYFEPIEKVKGYDFKSIAYYIYHIFRIEDIACNILMCNGKDILVSENYTNRLNAKVKTSMNDLKPEVTSRFSQELNIKELYHYAYDVYTKTDTILKRLNYDDLKRKFSELDKKQIKDEYFSNDSFVIIDYWFGSDLLHLLKVPFSKYWIMNFETIDRIIDKK